MHRMGVVQREALRGNKVWTPLARALAATGDRWTLMIVLALSPGRMRLTTLQRRLPGVSTGVLERHLGQMVELGLVTRTRFKEMPPRVELELTDAGHELLAVAGLLGRWGMRNRWSAPSERERIDVGALLRMLPTLVDRRADLPDGATIEALVDSVIASVQVLYEVLEGRLRLTVGDTTQDTEATTSVHGDEQGWIAALGPNANYEQLSFYGEAHLATLVLDALPRRLDALGLANSNETTLEMQPG